MVNAEASAQLRNNDVPWDRDPLMLCAITGRQPWIDRISDRVFERSFEAAFRRSIKAFRAREGLSARAFGLAALGDPDFIEGLLHCGAALRLDTVDAVLTFMGEPRLGPLFACEVEAYLGITGTGAQGLGQGAVGDASFVRRFRAGNSPPLRAVDRVRRWMGMHASTAQRRAIAAATLYPQWWRAEVGVRTQHAVSRGVGPGYTRAGAPPRYLDTRQAAEMIGLSPRTMEYYRTTGEGPAFYKLGGRVRYAVSEIERWVRARRRYRTRGAERAGPRRAATTRGSLNAS